MTYQEFSARIRMDRAFDLPFFDEAVEIAQESRQESQHWSQADWHALVFSIWQYLTYPDRESSARAELFAALHADTRGYMTRHNLLNLEAE